MDVEIVGRAAPDLAKVRARGGVGEGVCVANAADVAERFFTGKDFFSATARPARVPLSTGSQTERNEELCVGWPRSANQSC
jgi:hypothetical protein